MFRELRRKKQKLSPEECAEVLKTVPRGVLSVLGDDGYPYGVPMDHWYCPENGCLYFHSGRRGHKTDSLRRDEKVCYTVMDEGFCREGEWAKNIRSIVIFGRISFVEDKARCYEICRNIGMQFFDDVGYWQNEFAGAENRVICLELSVESMCGKIVNES